MSPSPSADTLSVPRRPSRRDPSDAPARRPDAACAERLDHAPAGGGRILSLDALRGFAIAGILPLNMVLILVPTGVVPSDSLRGTPWALFQVLIEMHFLPLFALLFGLTFGMMWRSGRDRRHRPHAALARRMAFLVVVGLFHQIIAPGESLLVFGLLGLLLLLPSTLLPRRALSPVTAVLGAAGILAGMLGAPLVMLIGGLLLLGYAIGAAGLAGCWERPGARGPLLGTAVITGALSALGAAAVLTGHEQAGPLDLMLTTQLVMGALYTAVLLLLMRTRAAGALRALFEPLGRCAMTCYVSASVIIWLLGLLLPEGALPVDAARTGLVVAAGSLAILAAQNLAMRWWLGRFTRGPLETLSRRMTWWTRSGDPRPAAPATAAAPVSASTGASAPSRSGTARAVHCS